jgi:hypothetical protein
MLETGDDVTLRNGKWSAPFGPLGSPETMA